MAIFKKIKDTVVHKSRYLGNPILIVLVTLGLMNIVHNLTYMEPLDGAEWEELENGRLRVVKIDRSIESRFQVGDVLQSVDGERVRNYQAYQDFLYSVPIGSKHLYVVDRPGIPEPYMPWVEIQGVKQGTSHEYYFFAVSGFLYLLFLFLILNRDVAYSSKRSLALFSVCVFLTFVFHYTNRFNSLDWISFVLDKFGNMVLPSALAGLALNQSLARNRWLGFLQGLHWIPSLLLMLFNFIWLFLSVSNYGVGDLDPDFFHKIENIQSLWGGGLIVASILMLALVAEFRSSQKNFSIYWAMSWIPFAFYLWHLEFPFSSQLAGLTPMILPIVLVIDWSRKADLYLAEIGKQLLVYFSVVFVLLLGYFLFLGIFQALVGTQVQSSGTIVLGIGIMFAAVTYSPLKQFAAEILDRLIYGKRFESIKVLSDFSGINRADTKIDEFLFIILNRIRKAFLIDRGAAFTAGENTKLFTNIDPEEPLQAFLFEELNPRLLDGDTVRGSETRARVVGKDQKSPFQPNDYVCPIRVTGNLAALIVFSLEGDTRKLSPEEMRLLESMLHQCDVLMENMELYQVVFQKAVNITQLKEYNENIIESSRIGILTTDEMERTVSCNQAMVELTGLARQEVMGKSFEQLLIEREIHSQRRVRSGFTFEGSFENARGDNLLLEIQRTPLKTKENEVYGTLYLVEDVREKKELSRKMQQQEKLASIGMLAAGVAHEINTPLTGIASYAQILNNESVLTESQRELLGLIQGQSQRAANIVNELLNFSRKESAPKGPTNLLSVLNQTLRFLHHQIEKRRVAVTVHEPRQPPMIEGYENQLQQVFINLILNAMDAMPEGGKLDVGFRFEPKALEMWFKDSGAGMDAKTKATIFDPFFTTKEIGKGTGLGLTVVFNILRDHNASVDVESSPKQGTVFHLWFPVKGETPASQPSPRDAEVAHPVE